MIIPLCIECEIEPVEIIDDWESSYCPRCNDRLIERSNRRREWDYYHPGEAIPKEELDP